MEWFRFYHSALHDPKVQTLDGETFKAWVNLLCLASEGNPRGRLPATGQIAFALRMDRNACETLLETLHDLGLLDCVDNVWIPHNWDGRQHKSDDVSARVAAWRSGGKQNGNVTPNVSRAHARSVSVSVLSGDLHPEDTETEVATLHATLHSDDAAETTLDDAWAAWKRLSKQQRAPFGDWCYQRGEEVGRDAYARYLQAH